MKQEDKKFSTRRDFLKTGFAAVLAGTACFTFGGLKVALAEAKKAEKPLLTAENLNALIPDAPNDQYFKLGKEAYENPAAFLERFFYISPEQKEGLASVSASDWEKVRKGIRYSLEKKADFVVFASGKRIGANIRNDAQFINAGYVFMKMEFEVSFEGGAKGGANGTEFEGKVTVTARKK